MIKILLVDDHEILRQGLTLLLNSQPDFEVVGQAADGHQALLLIERLHPDVIVLDMLMPVLNGMETTLQVRRRHPATHVVILSMHDDESYVTTALRNGASAYVLKDSSAADLTSAVRAAASGLRFLSPALTERAINAYLALDAAETPANFTIPELTLREREVFFLAIQGKTATEIAKLLHISRRTVETHRANLMKKLNIHSQEELLAYARRRHMLT